MTYISQKHRRNYLESVSLSNPPVTVTIPLELPIPKKVELTENEYDIWLLLLVLESASVAAIAVVTVVPIEADSDKVIVNGLVVVKAGVLSFISPMVICAEQVTDSIGLPPS